MFLTTEVIWKQGEREYRSTSDVRKAASTSEEAGQHRGRKCQAHRTALQLKKTDNVSGQRAVPLPAFTGITSCGICRRNITSSSTGKTGTPEKQHCCHLCLRKKNLINSKHCLSPFKEKPTCKTPPSMWILDILHYHTEVMIKVLKQYSKSW